MKQVLAMGEALIDFIPAVSAASDVPAPEAPPVFWPLPCS